MDVIFSGVYIPVSLLRGTLIEFLHTLIKIQTFSLLNFPISNNSSVCARILSTPTTRKQKKARKSRGLEMLSDIENLDIMLGERHSEREESVDSNSARRPESANSNAFENNGENLYLSHREMGLGNDDNPGQNSTSAISNAELNRLSSELNSRISREMDEMMNSVNTQIQRAISDAISNQVLPQIQNVLRAGSGHLTENRWNVPAERPEVNPEDYRSKKTKSNFRSELTRECCLDNRQEQAYDTCISCICKNRYVYSCISENRVISCIIVHIRVIFQKNEKTSKV